MQLARSLLPWARGLSEATLRDHGDELLRALVTDMEQSQSAGERDEKSKGRRGDSALAAIGHKHAAGRLLTGLTLKQLVAEYRALILMGASLLMKSERVDDKEARVATRIFSSAERMSRMVHDLLDFTRTRLGGEIPLAPRPLDLAELSRQVVAELEPIHPACRVGFDARGDLHGLWDGDRLSQAMSNMVANAMEYGCENGPVDVAVFAEGEHIIVRIHNEPRCASRGEPPPRAPGLAIEIAAVSNDQDAAVHRRDVPLASASARADRAATSSASVE